MSELSSKRIAKNTILLYFRTIIVLFVTLYSSRVILKVLGVENYGIYTLIGGFVSLFSIVSATLVASSQRFLTYELGKREEGSPQIIYSVSLSIHIALAIVILILLETIGLWFLNTHLNISTSRITAANWLYQFSIFTFLLGIVRAPFNAAIIAHEHMAAFAYTTMAEAILKLGILYIIPFSHVDGLIQYGVYLLIISILVFTIYYTVCRLKFKEIRFRFVKEKKYYREITHFASYNFLGSCSAILENQGINILLNIFNGVTVNAARGFATQIGVALSKFISDFTTALNPQITKSYAQGDIETTKKLMFKGAKFAFLLYWLFALPIIIHTPLILLLWLKDVPNYTCTFVRYALITALINTIATPITTCAFATGDIKKLSIWLGGIRLMTLPLAYLAMTYNLGPVSAYQIVLVTDSLLLFIRISIVSEMICTPKRDFFSNILYHILPIVIITSVVSILFSSYYVVDSISKLVLFTLISISSSIILIYILALDEKEKQFLLNITHKKIKK